MPGGDKSEDQKEEDMLEDEKEEDDDDDVMDDEDEHCVSPDPTSGSMTSGRTIMTVKEEEEIDVGHETVIKN